MTSKPRQNAYLSAAQREMQRGRIKRAQQLLLRLLNTEPQNQEAWLRLADTFQERDKAIRTLQHLLELNPHHAVAQKRLAELTRLVQIANQPPQTAVSPATSTSTPQPNWAVWLLIPSLLTILLLAGAFVWFNQPATGTTQIELINDDENRPETLATLRLDENWECTYNDALTMTEFSGQVINLHQTNAYDRFVIRGSILNEEFEEVGSSVTEEMNLNLRVGETAAFLIRTPNPTGSDICVIELIDATYAE